MATTLLSFTGEKLPEVVGPIGAMGLVTALVLIPLGVLATAGEWSHRTVQTTFLQVPNRSKVVAAKVAAVALMGAVLAAIAIAASAAVLSVGPVGDPSWDGAPMAMAVAVAAGAAFAVIGAGVGAAMANTPAALTTLYLTVLGGMPALRLIEPEIAAKLDPTDAVLQLAIGDGDDEPHADAGRLGRRHHGGRHDRHPPPRGAITRARSPHTEGCLRTREAALSAF